MAEDLWQDVQPPASHALLVGALDAFATRGFYATTTREIADRAGLSPAAVYVHYRSKAELLGEISRRGHEAALAAVEEALAAAGADPLGRLRRFVEAFSAWHAAHHELARVVQYELAALTPADAEPIARVRRRFGALLRQELRTGVRRGAFSVSDVGGTADAILSLGIDVARWYSPRSRRTPAAIGRLYAELALRMVGARRPS